METNSIQEPAIREAVIFTPETLLAHWQGHRKLSRKVIEAFPEEQLFNFSIGGMRTFANLSMEIISLAGAGIQGIVNGDWTDTGRMGITPEQPAPATKAELLVLFDYVTERLDLLWPQIAPERFQEDDAAFGQYEGLIYETIFYFIDNEIHHRAQGFVYLRALGIEPPAFWDRN